MTSLLHIESSLSCNRQAGSSGVRAIQIEDQRLVMSVIVFMGVWGFFFRIWEMCLPA